MAAMSGKSSILTASVRPSAVVKTCVNEVMRIVALSEPVAARTRARCRAGKSSERWREYDADIEHATQPDSVAHQVGRLGPRT